MKIAIILGTRPEIIKMSPIIRECEYQKSNYFILHTGQHYSYNLDKIFFQELELPEPKYNLNIGSGSHAEETGKMLIGLENILLKEKPDIVIVQGDTNTVLAGALAASKIHIKVGHIEAGLRSHDRNMPEEINRILTDHLSDYLFAPTDKARDILVREGISEQRIFITGNTIVDAIYQNIEIAEKKVDSLNNLNLKKKRYFLITAHRQENVDIEKKFKDILDSLGSIHKKYGLPIIFPIHPRAKKRIEQFKLEIPEGVRLIEPLGFLEFLHLEANAKLILTDSGGVQEETCILKVPCVTLRDNTERPETIEVGSNILAGINPENILEKVKYMLSRENNWNNPFGDGKSGKRIIKILNEVLHENYKMTTKIFHRFYDGKYYKELCPVSDGYSEYRAKKALKYIPKNTITILNIGCGYGFESKIFRESGYKVVGIDVSRKALEKAKEYQIESILGDVQEGTKLPDESFDVVYCAEVLEHLAFPSYFFEEVRRLLTKDGILVLMLPNIARLTNRISLLFWGQLSSDFNEEHLHEMTHRQIKKYLKDYGFKIIVFEGVIGKLVKFPTLSGEFFIVAKSMKTKEVTSNEN